MKALVGTFNQEKALLGSFSVITNLRMDFFQALVVTRARWDQTNLVLFRALAHCRDLHAEQTFATTLENICVNN